MRYKLLVGLFMTLAVIACGRSEAGPGEPCESDDDCERSLACNDSGICESCGGEGELCCAGSVPYWGGCAGEAECGEGGRCIVCGFENQVCCPGQECLFTHSLESGFQYFVCNSENTCVACGKANQLCCSDGCQRLACGSDGICHDEVCDQAGNCQPCGILDTSCCVGDTCMMNLACGPEGVCLNCGALDELACPPDQCDGWYSAFDGYCRIPFAIMPETSPEICAQARANDDDLTVREHSSWCYWYAAYYKGDTSLCALTNIGQMAELCSQGENPDDYFLSIMWQ